jgi:hypothetical protein
MDPHVNAVASVPLVGQFGITVVGDQQGWRFESLHRGVEKIWLEIREPDRQRHFPSAQAAAEYFAQHYGWKLVSRRPESD